MLTHFFLYAGLLPLVASAFIAFVMRQMRSPLPIVWPVAVAAGFLIAQLALRSQSGFTEGVLAFLQPHEAIDWLPHIVLLALGVSVVAYLAPSHRSWLIALAAALCLATPVRLLSGNVVSSWSVIEKLACMVALATMLALVWRLLASNVEGPSVFLRVPLLILASVGTAIVVTQSGVLVYGLSCAGLGAALSGTALVFAFRGIPSSAGAAATAGIITFTIGCLIILTYFFAELSTTSAALLFLALAATATPLPAFIKTGPPWLHAAFRVVACTLPLAVAMVSAFV